MSYRVKKEYEGSQVAKAPKRKTGKLGKAFAIAGGVLTAGVGAAIAASEYNKPTGVQSVMTPTSPTGSIWYDAYDDDIPITPNSSTHRDVHADLLNATFRQMRDPYSDIRGDDLIDV